MTRLRLAALLRVLIDWRHAHPVAWLIVLGRWQALDELAGIGPEPRVVAAGARTGRKMTRRP